MLPNNKARILTLCLLVFLIVGLLGFNFALSRYGAFWEKEQTAVQVSPPVLPPPVFTLPVLFGSPVDKEYFGEVKLVQLDLGQNDLGFSLPEGSPIYAGFEGTVEVLGHEAQRMIVLVSPDGKSRLTYIFSGSPEVENMDRVAKGEVLGKVGRSPLPTRDINLIVRYYENGQGVSLGQEIVEQLKNE